MEQKFPVIISEYLDVYLEWYVIPHWKFYIKRMETFSPPSFRFFCDETGWSTSQSRQVHTCARMPRGRYRLRKNWAEYEKNSLQFK